MRVSIPHYPSLLPFTVFIPVHHPSFYTAHWLTANRNFQSPTLPNHPSRQDDRMDPYFNNPHFGDAGRARGAIDPQDPRQSYGPNEWATPTGGWATSQYPTTTQATTHCRSISDQSHMTSFRSHEHSYLFNRRLSVPINNYGFPPAPQFLSAESQMLQAYPQMAGNQCQQYMGQSFDPSPLAPRPQDPLTLAIPPSVGGSSPGPHSTSSNNTPWYTPASSPQPSQRLSPGFIPGGSLSQHFDPAGGVMDRTPRPSTRFQPYQHDGAQQASQMLGNGQGSRSPENLSLNMSTSQTMLEGSNYPTSPGADSDYYHSFPNSLGDANGEETARKREWKLKQKLRKQAERDRENTQLDRVKKLLGSEKMTKADALEKVIKLLGGKVPARRNEPTQALEGRNRSDRAKQVSGARSDLTRLYHEIGLCLGFTNHTAPKRELLLQEVADEFERRRTPRTQMPAPREGAGLGGHNWAVR